MEQRRSKRKPFGVRAIIRIPLGCRLPVFVENISEGGAKLLIPDVALIPDHFVLEFAGTIIRDCRVAWRLEQSLGVTFYPKTDATRRATEKILL
jgi:hypothetical protein